MKKLTRLEANKIVRQVLNRGGVDLSYCQFACYGTEIRLTGWLCYHDGSEFPGPQVEALIYDFKRTLPGYYVTGEFDNWNFTSDHITYVGEKGSDNEGSAQEIEQVTYVIDIDDQGEAS